MKKTCCAKNVIISIIGVILYQGIMHGDVKAKTSNPIATAAKCMLPESAILGQLNFKVSPDHKHIFFFRKTLANETPELFLGVGKYVMFDMESASSVKIIDLIKEEGISGLSSSSGDIAFSPFGDSILIHATANPLSGGGCNISPLFEYNLHKKKKILRDQSYFSIGLWSGDKIIISSASFEEINKIKVIDIKKNTATILDIRGMLIASDLYGNLFAVQADPDKMDRQKKWSEISNRWHLLISDINGNITRNFGPIGDTILSKAIMSPKGNFLLYRDNASLHIKNVEGADSKIIDGNVEPIFITDSGVAITKEWQLIKTPNSKPRMELVAKAINVNGKEIRLLKNETIVDLAVAGGYLYYVGLAENQRGKVVKLNLKQLIGSIN